MKYVSSTVCTFLSLFFLVPSFLLCQEYGFSERSFRSMQSPFSNYPAIYFPPACHWMIAVSALGDSFEIEDGSIWKLNQQERSKILSWRSSDPLLLTQNLSWFSSHNYRMINTNTGSSIQVTLTSGPIIDGEYTRKISIIDPSYGQIVLTDTSSWQIYPEDLNIFYEWFLEDYIIIGTNSYFGSKFENILINVNMNSYVRAKEL